MRWSSKICRLCTKSSQNTSTIQLFDRSHKTTIRRIFQLTGVKLKKLGDIPTTMCVNCEIELNRAYVFRERCIASQTYFSSAEYKNHNGQTHRENYTYSRNNPTEATNTEVKLEVTCLNECEVAEVEKEEENNLKNDPEVAGETECEFIALNEDEGIPLINYDDKAELLDQPMMYTTCKSTQVNKTKDKIDIEVGNPIEHATVEDATFGPKPKVLKSKESKKAYNPRLKLQKERRNKARTYICDQCGNNFKYRSHFYSHIKRHTGVKPLQCEVCPNKFFTEGELKRHMRRHTGERPFPCQHCQRRFTDYSTRIKHERTHTNERPFECPQCNKAFTTSYVLKNHMLVHTGERSFKCELCDKSFQRQTHLNVHARSLAHKQNIERQQQRLMQQENDKRSFTLPVPSTIT